MKNEKSFKVIIQYLLEDYLESVTRDCELEYSLNNDLIEYWDYKERGHEEYFIQEDIEDKLFLIVKYKDYILNNNVEHDFEAEEILNKIKELWRNEK